METPFVSSEFGKKKEFGRKYANHELDCNCLSIRQLAKRGKTDNFFACSLRRKGIVITP